jgi:ubiquinone/menaquinone biosynthesis C-methylase UbiE
MLAERCVRDHRGDLDAKGIAMDQHERSDGWQVQDGAAAAYERYLVPTLLDGWAADLVAAVDVQPGQRVLDAACGTGIVARHAARRLDGEGHVAGVDVNPAMLEVARERGADLPITWEQAPVERLPFPDASFDVVLCQQALQFFPDRPAALAELFRVAAPGARLGVNTCRALEHQPGYRALVDVLARHVGVQAAVVTASPYALGDGDEVRALVEKAGFGEVHVHIAVWGARFASPAAFLRAETSSSPLGDLVTALDADVQDALVDDLAAALRRHTDDGGVVFPFETTVVTATW